MRAAEQVEKEARGILDRRGGLAGETEGWVAHRAAAAPTWKGLQEELMESTVSLVVSR